MRSPELQPKEEQPIDPNTARDSRDLAARETREDVWESGLIAENEASSWTDRMAEKDEAERSPRHGSNRIN